MEQATDPLNTETFNTEAPNTEAPNSSTFHSNTGPGGYSGNNPSSRFGRLTRTSGPISGVSGGLADYFNVDPTLVRLAMVAGTIIGGPTVPIAYIAAWIIIPEDDSAPVAPIMSAPATPPPPPAPPAPVPHPDAPTPASAPVVAVTDTSSNTGSDTESDTSSANESDAPADAPTTPPAP